MINEVGLDTFQRRNAPRRLPYRLYFTAPISEVSNVWALIRPKTKTFVMQHQTQQQFEDVPDDQVPEKSTLSHPIGRLRIHTDTLPWPRGLFQLRSACYWVLGLLHQLAQFLSGCTVARFEGWISGHMMQRCQGSGEHKTNIHPSHDHLVTIPWPFNPLPSTILSWTHQLWKAGAECHCVPEGGLQGVVLPDCFGVAVLCAYVCRVSCHKLYMHCTYSSFTML